MNCKYSVLGPPCLADVILNSKVFEVSDFSDVCDDLFLQIFPNKLALLLLFVPMVIHVSFIFVSATVSFKFLVSLKGKNATDV